MSRDGMFTNRRVDWPAARANLRYVLDEVLRLRADAEGEAKDQLDDVAETVYELAKNLGAPPDWPSSEA